MSPRTSTPPRYRVVLKTASDAAVVESKPFFVKPLALRYAEMWPRYNAYVFERGKLILSVPATKF